MEDVADAPISPGRFNDLFRGVTDDVVQLDAWCLPREDRDESDDDDQASTNRARQAPCAVVDIRYAQFQETIGPRRSAHAITVVAPDASLVTFYLASELRESGVRFFKTERRTIRALEVLVPGLADALGHFECLGELTADTYLVRDVAVIPARM